MDLNKSPATAPEENKGDGFYNIQMDLDSPQPHGSTNPRGSFFKVRVVVFVFATFAIYYAKNQIMPTDDVKCLLDKVQQGLSDLNKLVNDQPGWRIFFQISSSLLMDVSFLTYFIYWTLYGTSVRIICAMSMFYGVRGVIMGFFLLGFPDGYTWDYPGFPSIVVPYGRTSDFFYSGHCGFLVIVACEWFTLGFKKMCLVTNLITIYMAFVMVVCRIHFSIDIITGMVFGHYLYIVARHYSPVLDDLCKKIWDKVGETLQPDPLKKSIQEQMIKHRVDSEAARDDVVKG